MVKTILFWKTADGKCPAQEFLDSLSGKTAQKVAWVLTHGLIKKTQKTPQRR